MAKTNAVQEQGSVKHLETIVLFWPYINEWNWTELKTWDFIGDGDSDNVLFLTYIYIH